MFQERLCCKKKVVVEKGVNGTQTKVQETGIAAFLIIGKVVFESFYQGAIVWRRLQFGQDAQGKGMTNFGGISNTDETGTCSAC
jgi:hypothetical protein